LFRGLFISTVFLGWDSLVRSQDVILRVGKNYRWM
jgi:hypothetical protein